VAAYIHFFLNSALVGRVASRPGRFTPTEIVPRYPVDVRLAGLDNMEKRIYFTLLELEL
jgi:hypothetical protein